MSEVADHLQLLSHWVREGRHEEAQALLPFASPCVYASAATPWTALHLAAHLGRLRILRVFLRFICNAAGQDDARLSVDVRDHRGCTPLHRAARAGRVTAARMLLSAGARLDVVDADGKLPVVAAAARGRAEIVRLLLERGQTTVVCAREALAEALGVAQCWTTAQAVLRVCPYAASDGTAATTALLRICSALHTESPFRMVQLLCNMGANVNAVDEYGKSPLHFAALDGWVDVASFLIENCKSSAINRVDSYGDTPLVTACESAARHKRSLLVRLLLRQGANPNVTHESLAFSPLNAAACRKQVDAARALIDAGARMRLKAKRPGERETPAVLRAALRKSRAHLKWFAMKFIGIGSWSEPDGHGLFHAAAWSGDLGTMKLVVRLGANPKRVCADGRSALHVFTHGFTINRKYNGNCLSPCEDVVNYLVKTCRLNLEEQQEPAGYTPLHTAAIVEGCAEVVRALINSGAAIDCRCAKGMTPLMDAAWEGDYEVCEILLAAGAGANCKDNTDHAMDALLYAATGQFSNVVHLLIRNGASPTTLTANGANGIWCALSGPGDAALTVRQLLKAGTPASMILPRTGASLLHQAGEFNQISSIPLLVKYGAEINARDKRGRTALHVASWYASFAMLRILIEYGADVNAKDLKGRGSLHIAAETMNIYFVKLLLEAGADVHAEDAFGLRPLMYACKCNVSSVLWMEPRGFHETISMVGKLLEAGANVNARSFSGFSALHIACMAGRCDVVNVLIAAGAKLEAKTRAGRTPLHLAAMSDRTDALRVLAGHGALVDTKDSLGQNALHAAAARGHKQVVHALLALGMSDNAEDGRGRSALDAAARAGHTKVAALLLEHRYECRRIRPLDPGILRSALVAAQRHGRHETVQFLCGYGASCCGIITGIAPRTQEVESVRSEALTTDGADLAGGVFHMDELVDGERNMIARLSGRRRRSKKGGRC